MTICLLSHLLISQFGLYHIKATSLQRIKTAYYHICLRIRQQTLDELTNRRNKTLCACVSRPCLSHCSSLWKTQCVCVCFCLCACVWHGYHAKRGWHDRPYYRTVPSLPPGKTKMLKLVVWVTQSQFMIIIVFDWLTAMTKRKRTELSLAQKFEIVQAFCKGEKATNIATKFDIDRTTVTKIVKKKNEIETAVQVSWRQPLAS